jgi:hypothetical protein
MKDLVGRITALDPEASETLKVISYFDTLIDGRVSTEALLRGAAMLADAVVGHQVSTTHNVTRFAPNGDRLNSEPPGDWISHAVGHDTIVWLERKSPHANDPMVLERLAIALTINAARTETEGATRRAVEILLDGTVDEDQRLAASDRLRIDRHGTCKAVAIPPGVRFDIAAPQAMIATAWGILHAAVIPASSRVDVEAAGIGVLGSLGNAHRSWRTALVALRWTNAHVPIRDAADLGPLLLLADAFDSRSDKQPDVDAIDRLLLSGQWTLGSLQSLADGQSVRTVAVAAGLHHSTIQARLPHLRDDLGFDPIEPLGRTRLQLGLFLHAMGNTRFD